jgi:hypothetical protein
MTAGSTVLDIFRNVAHKMRLDFDATAVALAGRVSRGDEREEILREFLRKYLSTDVRIASTKIEVIDVAGNRSGQMDVGVLEPSVPPLWEQGGVQLVPVECVRSLFEVKSKLTWSELEKDLERIRAVKQMQRTAVITDNLGVEYKIYGQLYRYLPVFGYVFAFDSDGLEGLLEHVVRWAADKPLHELPDGIWVLGKGALIWQHSETGENHTTPEPGCRLSLLAEGDGSDLLLSMLAMTNRMVTAPLGGRFDFNKYLDKVNLGQIWTFSTLTLPITGVAIEASDGLVHTDPKP